MYDSEHVGDLIAGYAMGILDDEEVLRVAHHLAACTLCRLEAERYSRLVDRLASSAQAASPPEHLWARIEGRLKFEEHRGLERARKSSSNRTTRRSARRLAAPRRRLRLPTPPILTLSGFAACILVIAALAAFIWLPHHQSNSATLHISGMPIFVLSAANLSSKAAALVVASADGDRGTLIVDGLSPLRAGRTYQVWLCRRNTSVGGATFSVDKDGYATVGLRGPLPLTAYTSFNVTMEPAGGSRRPTGPEILGTAPILSAP